MVEAMFFVCVGVMWGSFAVSFTVELIRVARASAWPTFVCIVIGLLWPVTVPLAVLYRVIKVVIKKVKNHE